MTRRRLPAAWKACLALASAGALATLGTVSANAAKPPLAAPPAPKIHYMYVTYYGWFDNSPPGNGTAFGSGHAGGLGTFQHPITFASDKTEFKPGTIIYYPTVEKYFVMGDSCTECHEDWVGKGPDGGPHLFHVDMWLNGNGGNEFDAINCEDALTQGTPSGGPLLTPVIVNPPSNEGVSTQPLFNSKTNACFGGATQPTAFGQYQNRGSRRCITDPGNSTRVGTLATVAKCDGRADQNLGFNGAFFRIHGLCLGVKGANTPGSKLAYSACLGGPNQQWSVNSNGTITGIQTAKCVAQSGASLELANCKVGPPQQWAFKAERAP